MALNLHTASEIVKAITEGLVTSEALIAACLERVDADGGRLGVWAHLNPDAVLEQARALDELRQAGRPMGRLHGIPVAVGDSIDTAGTPTGLGCRHHAHRVPERDATLVGKLREAGAVIFGKTATGTYGIGAPGATANPHDPARSPGAGGAAAAVAAGHVPLAVDRQQGGESILSAAYCGVFGLVPSRGMISRRGMFRASPTLDRVGITARSLEDAACLADALTGYDDADPATYPRAKPCLTRGVSEAVPVEPNFVVLRLPHAVRLSPDISAAFAELTAALAERVVEVEVPSSFGNTVDHRNIVLDYELHRALSAHAQAHPEDIGTELATALERGGTVDAGHYAESLAVIDNARLFLADVLTEFDAIVTPAACGVAPPREEGGCDTLFTAAFDFCGLPSLSLPLLEDAAGLPVGVQLIGNSEDDARLCRSARWLQSYLAAL